MNWRMRTWFVILIVALLGFGSGRALFGQRADRGIITGLVTDPAGAAVAKATVRVINEATNVETAVETTDAGNYSTPLLILGTYTVKVEKEGFKVFARPGIILTAGAEYRQDVRLELGAVTQTVEVRAAAQMINTQNAEVSSVVNEKFYHDLPVVMGADIRLAESLLHVQPGYIPMQPNGDTMFRGTQFNSRINGGQTMTVENWFDGAAFGFSEGHQQTQESALPYESIREMKVISGTFSAQYGHSSGGVIEYVTKSGTSQFHGSVYEYLGNDALQARGFFLPKKNSVRQNSYGFSAGGPIVIPKVYDGRGKTFFFFTMDFLDMIQGIESGFTNTVPIAPFRNGDFSQLLNTNQQVATDVLGRPIYSGEIFMPSSTRTVGGVPVRNGYGFDPATGLPIPGMANIIPSGDPLHSQIAAKLLPLIPLPDRPQLANNLLGGTGDASHIFHVKTPLIRVDHTVTPNLKSTTSFYMNSRPSVRHCGEVEECNTKNNPFSSDPGSNADYIGSGFFQRITNRFVHQQFDWIIKPNLYNHTTVSYDRWVIGGHPLGVRDWNAYLGIKGVPTDGGALPNFNFAGNLPYSHLGRSWYRGFGYDANNRWQFLDDVTWIRSKHTVKAGFEFRNMNYPEGGWGRETMGTYNFSRNETAGYDRTGNNVSSTGDPYASFILGQLDNATLQTPAMLLHREFLDKYRSLWVNDEIKATDRLTLNIGLRWDYIPPRYEKYDRYSSFVQRAPNPVAPGVTLPGALVFAGTGPGRSGKRTFEDSIKDAWGPRFGFAYQLGSKNVVRGGYGMYYSNIPFSQFAPAPIQGFETNPTAPNLTNGQFPAFYFDSGFPQNLIIYPPQIDPTLRNNLEVTAVPKDGLHQPRYQNWNITIERQVTDNLVLDIAYVGNHGTRLPAQGTLGGLLANMSDPKVLALGASVLQGTDFAAAGINIPYAGFPGDVAQALRPYPQYGYIHWRDMPIGHSIYHALEIKLDRRWSNGLQARVAYTWSKLINDGAESAQGDEGPSSASSWQGNGVQNPLDTQKAQRGLSVDDVPHTLVLSYSYELPLGPGKKFANTSGPVGKVVGGWSVSAIQRYQSGRPVSINMANDLGGLIFNAGKRPDKVKDTAAHSGKFDPATDRYFDPAGWADPGPLKFGNSSRTDPHLRSFHWFNEDFNIFKDTLVYKEEVKMRFEGQFGNIFNRHFFCNPNNFWDTPSFTVFGTVTTQCDVPRRIQFGLRFDW
jgi:hypothetical protein